MSDEFAVLGDCVARERRSDRPALRHPPSGRAYDWRRFCTTAWKVGNYLRNEGVREGAVVGVAAERVPEPVLTLVGASMLGATVQFDPPKTGAQGDLKALVVPTARVGEYDHPAGTRYVAYGDDPADPSHAYFEREVWSENPTAPPDVVHPETALLAVEDRSLSHGTVLGAAREVAGEWGLDADATVAVRGPLTHPGVVAAGVVAPLLAGGEILLPDAEAAGDCAVLGPDPDGAPEPRTVAAGDVLG
ncbi:AMP-binding protein [Haloglomus litoreum]|uniref:AMP-binding protein n=1 Tax=Haloglomus litoreum TaxID=3034026 RepID=UPI0023E89ADC|nr:AMP-binding protein [Haloglomus sp. DT116]